MSRPTAGELLAAAREQLLRVQQSRETPVRPSEVGPVAQALGKVMIALARLLDTGGAVSDPGMLGGASRLTGWPQAVLVARGRLMTGLGALEPYGATASPPSPRPEISQLAGDLQAAAAALTAAHDLMHTHLAPAAGGSGQIGVSEWAPVILAESTTRAVGAEAAAIARQAAAIAAGLGQSCTAGRGRRLAQAGGTLRSCAQALWSADEAVQAAHRQEPPRAVDLGLLHAIPVNIPPSRVLPRPQDRVPVLCEGTIRTAERVRQATWAPSDPRSPGTTDTSLRSTAAAAVVISHNCATALETLAASTGRPGPPRSTPSLAGVTSAARLAAASREKWLNTAIAWGDSVLTDTTGSRSALSVDAGDLAWWTGRLAYADPAWSPARGRNCAARAAEELLAPTVMMAPVVGAMHAAAETLCRLAEAEQASVGAIASAGRLYVPARLLPVEVDNPRPYGPAQLDHVDGILTSYAAAHSAGLRLAAAMAQVARETGAPTQMLAAMRAVASRGPAPRAEEPPPPGPVGQLLLDRGMTSPALLLRAAALDSDLGHAIQPGLDAGPRG